MDTPIDKIEPAKSDQVLTPSDMIPGDITFHGDNHVAALRICSNGKFFVNGKEIAEDREVYHAMRRFLQLAEKGDSAPTGKPREIWRKVIAFDFDGVISSYDGWKGVDVFGQPDMKVVYAMRRLHVQDWKIVIFTTRIETPKLRAWLKQYDVPYDSINSTKHNPPDTSIKPIYHVIVDDRAVQYRGQDTETLERDIMAVYEMNHKQYNNKSNE